MYSLSFKMYSTTHVLEALQESVTIDGRRTVGPSQVSPARKRERYLERSL